MNRDRTTASRRHCARARNAHSVVVERGRPTTCASHRDIAAARRDLRRRTLHIDTEVLLAGRSSRRPLNRDRTAPSRCHLSGIRDMHSVVVETSSSTTALTNHRDVAPCGRDLGAITVHEHADICASGTGTARALDGHGSCRSAENVSAAVHPHTNLTPRRIVTTFSLDRDQTGPRRLNQGVVDIDANKVATCCQHLLIRTHRQIAVDRREARSSNQRHIA